MTLGTNKQNVRTSHHNDLKERFKQLYLTILSHWEKATAIWESKTDLASPNPNQIPPETRNLVGTSAPNLRELYEILKTRQRKPQEKTFEWLCLTSAH